MTCESYHASGRWLHAKAGVYIRACEIWHALVESDCSLAVCSVEPATVAAKNGKLCADYAVTYALYECSRSVQHSAQNLLHREMR